MTVLKQFRVAVVVGLLFVGAALGQQPVRAVYVTGQDGNPRVMYVTGTVPPERMPTVIPAAPTNVPARVTQVRRDVPAHLPAPMAAPEPAPWVESASCPTKHCGKHCKHGPTSCWTCLWTPATVPAPLGASVRSAFDMQRDNALAEYFVIYREDWFDAKFTLNDTNVRHLDGVIRRLGMIGAPVKVEPTGIAELDQKRVTAIIEKLVQAGIPAQEAASRVTLGTSRAEGLRYGDIENLYRGNSGSNNNRGNSVFGGSGFGGSGFGGSGFGGFGYR